MSRKVRGLSLGMDIDEQMALISHWKPDVLVAPASHYRTLIRFSEQEGRSLSFKVAIANGEMLDGGTRKLISDKFHTDKVYETYGAAEVGPIAWECPAHTGYHLNAESLFAEFLRDGEPVAPGEPGEICLTNLYRRATPMIRYLVGDVVTSVDADCPCGRRLPLIKDKQGRLLDFILTKRGRHVSPFRVMHMLEDVPGVARYKVVQKSDYSIELLVETMKQEATEQMFSALRERCAELFGELPVGITFVDRIENPKGQKFQVVESQIARRLQQTSPRVT
jgi:phenylacetate-CoA ligase